MNEQRHSSAFGIALHLHSWRNGLIITKDVVHYEQIILSYGLRVHYSGVGCPPSRREAAVHKIQTSVGEFSQRCKCDLISPGI
jgi:transposase-like protein